MEYLHDVMSDGETRAQIFKEGKKYHVFYMKKRKVVLEERDLPSLKVAENRACDWCIKNTSEDTSKPYQPVLREE